MIEAITLSGVLPQVFRGMESDRRLKSSQVWMRDIEFRRGNCYLIGAESGTGKSSLLSFIYGIRKDYDGTISFDSRDINSLADADWSNIRCHNIALLPQELRLFPELTVIENIELKNQLTHFKTANEISAMLQLLEIDNKANTPVRQLSLGQQQRAALVRSLCQPFDFLLMDEPVSHLDARNNSIAARLVAEQASQTGAGVIVTSVGYDMAIDRAIKLNL